MCSTRAGARWRVRPRPLVTASVTRAPSRNSSSDRLPRTHALPRRLVASSSANLGRTETRSGTHGSSPSLSGPGDRRACAAIDGVLAGGSSGARARLDRIVQERDPRRARRAREDLGRRRAHPLLGRAAADRRRRYAAGQRRSSTRSRHGGATRAELSDLDRPGEQVRTPGKVSLYEVYTARSAPRTGAPLLFETYQRSSALDLDRPSRSGVPFAGGCCSPASSSSGSSRCRWPGGSPTELRSARQQERERAAGARAVEASADERRRIAAELHDGVVQDLAGISYSLERGSRQVRLAQTSPAVRARRCVEAAIGDARQRSGASAYASSSRSIRRTSAASGLDAALRRPRVARFLLAGSQRLTRARQTSST